MISSSEQDSLKIQPLPGSEGYKIEHRAKDNIPLLLRELAADPPDAIVIPLFRAPMSGRDIALAVKQRKKTRKVRLVFAGGEAEKIRMIKSALPDAYFASTWEDSTRSIHLALSSTPTQEAPLKSIFDVYKGTPLSKKLGIVEDSLVLLQGAPKNLESTIDAKDATVVRRVPAHIDCKKAIILWFVRSRAELESGIKKKGELLRGLREQSGRASIWIIWRKKSPEMKRLKNLGLSQDEVRKIGLENGMVDYKICSIDESWSGLLFSLKKEGT